MSPRHFYRAMYPEQSKDLDRAYAEAGILVVNSVSRFVRSIIPFFIPQEKKINKIDKNNAEGIDQE
jgi:hypothetical protein